MFLNWKPILLSLVCQALFDKSDRYLRSYQPGIDIGSETGIRCIEGGGLQRCASPFHYRPVAAASKKFACP
jgi:hypothetical protein